MKSFHPVLIQPGDRIYCPYHHTWEVMLDDDSLCDWCCQEMPCPMHGDGSLPSDEMEYEEDREIERAAIEAAKLRHPVSSNRRTIDVTPGIDCFIDLS